MSELPQSGASPIQRSWGGLHQGPSRQQKRRAGLAAPGGSCRLARSNTGRSSPASSASCCRSLWPVAGGEDPVVCCCVTAGLSSR